MKKRVLSMLLCLCMVLAFFPATAFAEDGEEHYAYVKISSMEELTTGQYVLVTSQDYAPLVFESGDEDKNWVTVAAPQISGNIVTSAEGAVWTITVDGRFATLTDHNGVSIAPKSGNNSGILAGSYRWAVACENGVFTFSGTGDDTTILASNRAEESKLRAYKTSTVTAYPDAYLSTFTLYKWSAVTGDETGGDAGGGTGSDTGDEGASGITRTATLVTDVSSLAIGDSVIIVAADFDYALSTNTRGLGTKRDVADITKDGTKRFVTFGEDTQVLTLAVGTTEGTWAFNTGSGYLYASSSTDSNLETQDVLDANGSWAITIDDTGAASIQAQGSNTRNCLRYSFANTWFSCYAEGNDKQAVAIYKVVTHIITFDPNGGTLPDGVANTATTNTEGKLATLPIPTREGYEFYLWYKTDKVHDDITTETVFTEDTTLHARWVRAIQAVDFSLSGYGNGLTVSNLKLSSNDNDVTVVSYSIFNDENGTNKLDASYTLTQGEDYYIEVTLSLSEEIYTVETLTLNGVTSSFKLTQDGSKMTVWFQLPTVGYIITFDPNGGTLPDGVANTATTNAEGKLDTLPIPTREGYTFEGWWTEQAGGNGANPGDVFSENTTLYAHWRANTYTVTFDPNGGVLDTATATTDSNGKLTTLPTPTRSGSYRFDGWYTAETGGELITTETVFTAGTTIYAHWSYIPVQLPSYTVTVGTAVGGTVTVSPKNATEGATVTITVAPKAGHVLESLTVTDSRGNEVELTSLGNGNYTFQMPAGSLTVAATFTADQSKQNPFVDVSTDQYYYDAVLWAVQNGVTDGIGSTHFGPDLSCTRAQLVTFLWQAAGCPVVNYAMRFTDVDETTWYSEAVRWAASLGIVDGYGTELFGTSDDITREQVVTILYRYARMMGHDVSQGGMAVREFADYESVSDYALSAMQWAVNVGIVEGSDGMLLPQASCTRAQIVTMLYRLL